MANSAGNGGKYLIDVPANSRFLQAIAKLQQDLSKRFHVADLARESGLSIRSFHDFFKQEMGATFVEFYHNLRMARAREFLAETEQSIKVIALDLGYMRLEVFDHEFKQAHGCTPTEYRRSLPKKSIELQDSSILDC